MQFVDQCVPSNLPVLRTLFCRCCDLKKYMPTPNSQDGHTQVIIDLMRVLWKVNLMLMLNCSLLKRE